MSETLPPTNDANLYAPRPPHNPRPGMTPLGALALVLGGISVIALATLMAGGSIPGIDVRTVSKPQATHTTSTSPSTSATATPSEPATPTDAEIHATVAQETRRLVAQVQTAQQQGDTETLQQLQTRQIVTSDRGFGMVEQVIFGGNDVTSSFWVTVGAQDSSGQVYNYMYDSHQDEYRVLDPGAFSR